MSVIIKDMDKADRCADCQLLQTYQEHPFASVEMWCGVTDERIDNMQMVLPTCPIIADRKTENSSEKPNNCEHITEDGVTCAKYPACDDCLDNPLNKVKGSERLVKGSEQTDCLDRYDHKTEPTISKIEQVEDEPQTDMAEDIVRSFGFKTESYRQAKAKDEPQTERSE